MEKYDELPDKGEILIVDDTPANLRLLASILAQQGYAVRQVPNGKLALSSIRASHPDLVLLDIKMPDMDGYAVCRELKADPHTREIPIIFISALQEVFDKVKAFEVGGLDYITKPFQTEEVLARVKTHLALRHLQQTLQERNIQLQQEIAERTRAEEALHHLNDELEGRVQQRTSELQNANLEIQEALERLKATQEQLIQAEKMALLISLVAGVAHEINNPVGVGLTAASHLEQKTREMDEMYRTNRMKRSDLEKFLETIREGTGILLRNLQLASERTQSFKEIAVDQARGEQRRFKLKAYLDEIILSLSPKLKRTRHTISVNCASDLIIESYPGAFSQIVSNLILNSLIHGFDEQEHGEIYMNINLQEHVLVMVYHDNGKGMEPKQCDRVFEAFFTTKRDQGGSGLGMNIVYKLVTQKLHGQITCESAPGKGTTFTIKLPLEKNNGEA